MLRSNPPWLACQVLRREQFSFCFRYFVFAKKVFLIILSGISLPSRDVFEEKKQTCKVRLKRVVSHATNCSKSRDASQQKFNDSAVSINQTNFTVTTE